MILIKGERKMKKLVKINAELLVKALGIAATGGGKGFLLLIQPGSALVASCDGTKVAQAPRRVSGRSASRMAA